MRCDFYVYCWTGPTGAYVGKGRGGRAAQHLSLAAKGRTTCPKFYSALRRYGPDAFSLTYLATALTEAEALRDEMLAIYLREPEYNLTAGGEGASGAIRSQETRAKLSRALLGRPKSPAHRDKMSSAQTGRKHTQEARVRISDALCQRSPEVRARAAAANMKFSAETRAEALGLIAAGLSQRAAGRQIGVPRTTVQRWVKQTRARRFHINSMV